MSTLPLPPQTLAWLIHAADAGQCDAQALLHLIARADQRDQDGVDDSPVANSDLPARVLAMCRQRNWSLDWTCRGAYLHLESSELIEALRGKRGDPKAEAADVLLVLMSITENAGIPWGDVLEQVAATCTQLENCGRYSGEEWTALVEDAKGTESDSVSDTAQRITDYAVQAGLTVQDWAKAFNAASVDDSPVANALLQAEAALADLAEGEPVSPHAVGCLHWAEARCAEALAAIRPVMKEHGFLIKIDFVKAPPSAPTPRPTALMDVVDKGFRYCQTGELTKEEIIDQ